MVNCVEMLTRFYRMTALFDNQSFENKLKLINDNNNRVDYNHSMEDIRSIIGKLFICRSSE